MTESNQEHTRIRSRRRFTVSATLGVTALVGVFVFTAASSQASSSHQSARVAAANTACNSYLAGIQRANSNSSSSSLATIIDAYPTTAGNLATWLLNFDPMGESSAYSSIPPAEEISACILKGNWTLPDQSDLGSSNVNYEIVMISPDGTATPRMWGGSVIVNAAPPAIGS
jgi:hypothetical protein